MKKYLLIPALTVVLFAQYALADIDRAPIKHPTSVPLLSGGLVGIVCLGLQWLFTGAIIFSVALTLLAAYDYLRSSGDPAKVKSATNRLIFVAIGVAVAILARSLPVLVGSIFGATGSTDTSSVCK